MSKEILTPNWAVFNGHVNDASKRALESMDKWAPTLAEEIRKIEAEEGIMAIFNTEPTQASASYAALVSHFVNEDRERDEAA